MASITGTPGADTLNGTTGADTMTGLAGNDTYVVNHCDDVVVEANGTLDGIDTVKSSVSFVLLPDVENLTLTGTAAIDGTGNLAGNIMIGNGAENRITTGGGNDSVSAGAGNDVIVVDGDNALAGDKIDGGTGIDRLLLNGDYAAGLTLAPLPNTGAVVNVEEIDLADGNSYKLTLNDATNTAGLTVDGSALTGANTLILDGGAETKSSLTAFGGAGDDSIAGGKGNDLLLGGAGADSLTGGGGTDTVSYAGSAAGVTVDLTLGAQGGVGDASGDQLSGFKNVVGSDLDDTLTGDNQNNSIAGGAGNDTLVANGGNDTVLGGDGNDRLVLDANLTTADKIDGGDGNDTLVLNGDYSKGFAFGANVTSIENIELTTGNSYKLTLGATTNNGGLVVDGSALGGGNNLTFSGAASTLNALTVTGGAGNDSILGGGVADTLSGGTGNDTLAGGAGNDLINVGAALTAADKVDGGTGSDTVLFNGNYSGGVTFTATTVTNVETFAFAAGNDYTLTLNNATNSAGLTIDGSKLGAGDNLSIDAKAETASAFDFIGGAGADSFLGGAGKDTFVGGAGNDSYDGGTGVDLVTYASSLAGVTVDLSGNVPNAGGDAAGDKLFNIENVIGSTLNDVIGGDKNANVILGGSGDDALGGGAGGNDTISGEDGDDTIAMFGALTAADKLDGGDGLDILELNGDYKAGLVFGATTAVNFEAIIVDAGFNYNLTLNDATNGDGLFVDATALVGTTLKLNAAAEKSSFLDATGGTGNDTIIGGGGADTLDGGAGNDSLSGGAGLNLLHGGAGADTLVGGAGVDTADYSGSAAVTIDMNLVTQVGGGDAAGDRLSGIENIAGSAGNDKITGNSANNYLDGAGGADTLIGGAGNDSLEGGGGDSLDGGVGIDMASYVSSGAVTVDLSNNANNAGGAAGDKFTNIEGVLGSNVSDNLVSGSASNILSGGKGDDVLTAGSGNDTLNGGDDNDLFVMLGNLNTLDRIDGGNGHDTIELQGNYSAGLSISSTAITNVEEIDLLASGFNYRLAVATGTNAATHIVIDGSTLGLDTLYLAGSGAGGITATGSDGADTLIGGAGGDVLNGGAGADILNGGTGVDTVSYAGSAAAVTVNLALTTAQVGGDAAGDRLSGFENATGSGNDDLLIGTTAINQLDGGLGDDTLIGAGGADILIGGGGSDTADYSASKAGITIDLGSGGAQKGGDAEGDTLSGIENVIGSAFNDTFIGALGANAIDGGKGIDTVNYAASKTGVTVDLANSASNAGDLAGGDVLTNIENVTGSGKDDSIAGNASNNLLLGGLGADTLAGGLGGNDTLKGDIESDQFLLGKDFTSADQVDGGTGVTDTTKVENDVAILDGDYSAGVKFTATTMLRIETIQVTAGHDYSLTLNDATNAGKLTVDASGLGAGDTLFLDSSAETTGKLTVIAGAGADTIIGGKGEDTVLYSASTGPVTVDLSDNANNAGGAAGDRLTNIENLGGSAFDDSLTGNSGANKFFGDLGADTMEGGAGIDTAVYGFKDDDPTKVVATAITVDLATGVGVGGNAAGDLLLNIENVDGTLKGDSITGSDQSNVLNGFKGDDTLVGGDGKDTLVGGDDADTIIMDKFLTADDRLDGSNGVTDPNVNKDFDTLVLDGDYSAGVTFKATTAINFEEILLKDGGGSSYKLKLDNATNNAGLIVDGSALTGADHLYLDGSAETKGSLTATSGTGSDSLVGGAGNDMLDGGAGADTLSGGAGNDTVTYTRSTNAVHVDLTLTGVQAGSGDEAGDKLTGIENLIGSGKDDVLIGDKNANILEGAAGADSLDGGAGIDLASYAHSASAVTVDLSDNTNNAGGDAAGDVFSNIEGVIGSDLGDTLVGDGSANKLVGGAGNDTITADCGNDTVVAGDGDDKIILDHDFTALDRIDGGDGNDTVLLNGNYGAGIVFGAATLVNVEAIQLAAGHSYKFTLGDANNTGNLTIDGGALGKGETLYVNDAAETTNAVTILGGAGNDTVFAGAGNDTLSGGAGNDRISGGGGADQIDAGDGNDSVSGGEGGDVITAGKGVDTLGGGGGDDQFVLGAYLTAADRIDGGAGTDEVVLTGDYSSGLVLGTTTIINAEKITLGDGFSYKLILDNATNTTGLTVDGSKLTGANSLDLDGSRETTSPLTSLGGHGDDHILGGAGADTLSGGFGADTLAGGAGIDTVSYAASLAGVTVNLSTGVNAGGDAAGDQLSGFENIVGSAFGDHLTGDAGNNFIDGGLGADTIDGGAGIDTVSYAGAAGFVGVDLVSGTTTSGDLLVRVENVIGGDHQNDLFGDGAANLLVGGADIDILSGGGANDTLIGGGGGDFLEGGVGADSIDGGSGRDTIDYTASSAAVNVDLSLATPQVSGGDAHGDVLISIEDVYGTAFNDHIKGSDIKNYLWGGAGADTIDGGGGFDYTEYTDSQQAVTVNLTLTGPQSSTGDANGDVLINVLGVSGSAFGDHLIGGAQNEAFYGNGGSDTITTGAGSDLIGYNSDAPALGVVDLITDFQVGVGGDVFQVGNVIHGLGGAGGDITDFLRIVNAGGQTMLQIDEDGKTNGTNFIDLAILQGVSSATTVTQLFANGQIDTTPVTD